MRWTGTRPSQVVRLQPGNFHLDEATPLVKAVRACGGWSCPSTNSALERTARIAGRLRTELRWTGSHVADIQNLNGHTAQKTTMIYAPPPLQQRRRPSVLERGNRAPTAVSFAIRLADSAGSFGESSVNY